MPKSRLEAFTDGVIAIIITILVLELNLPVHNHTWSALRAVAVPFMVYVISFMTVATVWVNHHHLFQQVDQINETVIWSNILFLFFLSLLPAVTAWFGSDIFSVPAAILYEIDIIAFNLSFAWINHAVLQLQKPNAQLHLRERREMTSLITNALVFILIFFWPPIILLGRLLNWLMWLRPSTTIKNKS